MEGEKKLCVICHKTIVHIDSERGVTYLCQRRSWGRTGGRTSTWTDNSWSTHLQTPTSYTTRPATPCCDSLFSASKHHTQHRNVSVNSVSREVQMEWQCRWRGSGHPTTRKVLQSSCRPVRYLLARRRSKVVSFSAQCVCLKHLLFFRFD